MTLLQRTPICCSHFSASSGHTLAATLTPGGETDDAEASLAQSKTLEVIASAERKMAMLFTSSSHFLHPANTLGHNRGDSIRVMLLRRCPSYLKMMVAN